MVLSSAFGKPMRVSTVGECEVVAMLVVHVDDIRVAVAKEITYEVVAYLNKRFPANFLAQVTWCMGSECKRGREKRTMEILRTWLIRNIVEISGTTNPSPIPASPSLDLRHVNNKNPVVGASYLEMVGSPMRIANQTRPDITNVIRVVTRFSHSLRRLGRYFKYLCTAAHLDLMFRKGSKLEDVQWIITWKKGPQGRR